MEKIVVPGEFLGYAEELVAGPNTIEDEHGIYATAVGEKKTDESTRKVWVNARRVVRPMAKGDMVYGKVHDLYDTVALIEIQPEPHDNVYPSNETKMAFLRIGEISSGYVEHFGDVLRIGDYVKAQVLEVKSLGTYLTIKSRGLGVIRAICSYCRSEMKLEGNEFVCGHCSSREHRKLPTQ